jgi:hypothetical protein
MDLRSLRNRSWPVVVVALAAGACAALLSAVDAHDLDPHALFQSLFGETR